MLLFFNIEIIRHFITSMLSKLCFREIKEVMEKIYEKALNLQKEKAIAKKEVNDKLNFTEQQLMLLTQEMKDKIHQMVEDVEQKVNQ